MIISSIDLFKSSPIIGIGLGSFMHYETLITHNDYLLILAEQGLFGIILFLTILINFVKKAYKVYLFERTPINICMFFTILGICLYFFFINAYDHIVIWTLFAA